MLLPFAKHINFKKEYNPTSSSPEVALCGIIKEVYIVTSLQDSGSIFISSCESVQSNGLVTAAETSPETTAMSQNCQKQEHIEDDTLN